MLSHPASSALLAAACLLAPAAPALADQPNVLLIYVDDVGYADVSAYDHAASDVSTPNIDRIAGDGVRFTNAYAASPICNVSRTAVITGQYPQRLNKFYYGGPGLEVFNGPTLANQLQDAGYHTAKVGKTHIGSNNRETSRTDAQIRVNDDFPVNHGFNSFLGAMHSELDYERNSTQSYDDFINYATSQGVPLATAQQRARDAGIGPLLRGTHANGTTTIARESHDGYATDIFTDEAISQIQNTPDGQPFFVQVNYNSIHAQMLWATPQSYRQARGIDDADITPLPYDGTIPMFGGGSYNTQYGWFNQPGLGDPDDPRDTAENRLRRDLYLAAMDHLDDNVGRLLDELDNQGLTEDTIVIFTADNGGSHNVAADNAPLSGHKFILAEGGIRVPYLVSWKGQTVAGSVSHDQASHLDFGQTILAAAGITPAIQSDGRDLTGVIKQEADQDYRTQFWDSGFEWVVRHGNWKLRRVETAGSWPNITSPAGTFLYNLDTDIGESVNLAGANPEIVAALTALHTQWEQQNYSFGPGHRDNTLITNGSFEHVDGRNLGAHDWEFSGVFGPGGTSGVEVNGFGASDGIWRVYMYDGQDQVKQTTDHAIVFGDVLTLSFEVNASGALTEHGFTAHLFYVDEQDQQVDIAGWSLTQLADDGDSSAWQQVSADFTAELDAAYLGRPLGVRVVTAGPEQAYRALDNLQLTVVNTLVDADANQDGQVNDEDLAYVLSRWGNVGAGGVPTPGDLDGDGAVGASDLDIVLGGWQSAQSVQTQAGVVPEPGSALALGGWLWLASGRWGR